MSHHDLKSWPGPFAAVCRGQKTYEVRKADRDFKPGDSVDLKEWNPDLRAYTGEVHSTWITYVTEPGTFGMPTDVCVFGLGGHR